MPAIIETITYDELMKECNIDDAAEFRRLLRNRRGLPQISPRKPIAKRDAEEVVRAITGQKLDWYKYETQGRDKQDEGPLVWDDSIETIKTIHGWYLDFPDAEVSKVGTQLVGLACNGGFLAGNQKPSFVVSFEKGVNFIIGDRGSGKTTVLGLLGAVSDSVGEETQVLVKRLLSIIHPENVESENERAGLNRRILKILRHYSIDEYGLFFSIQGAVYCYYVNRKKKTYAQVEYSADKWQYSPHENAILKLPLLFFSQGEVVRIAEVQGQNYYLNNLLDAIYPDLFEKRSKAFQQAKTLLKKYKNYKPFHAWTNTQNLRQFIFARYKELDRMQRELSKGQFTLNNENLVYSYLYREQAYADTHPSMNWDKTQIVDFLRDKNDDVFNYLYVHRIKKFLYNKLHLINTLRRPVPVNAPPGDFESLESDSEIAPAVEAAHDDDDMDEEPPTLDGDLVEKEIQDDGDTEDAQLRNEEKNLFLQSVEQEQKVWESRELLFHAGEVIDFLKNRLQIMENWGRIYAYHREAYTPELRSLIHDYRELLEQKAFLIKNQSLKCVEITRVLNKDNFAINITTPMVETLVNDVKTIQNKINHLDRMDAQIRDATPEIKFSELRYAQQGYDLTLVNIRNEIVLLEEQINQEKTEYFSFPIKIELMQGNIFRDFQQLSFGQKSGIILKMVLSTTSKSIIVIDQPEDNLDAFSIINIIAPALKNLQSLFGRQIIVVTHNSNLVMQTSPDRLIALESRGNSGRINYIGPPVGKQAVREIFDILEGGIQTFSQKITTYENFVGMAKKIEDWDIELIERSFRQRTIDGLRNYLQPIVTDKSMLDFLRHQLKQWDPNQFRQDIREFINRLELMEANPEKSHNGLLEMLTGLAEILDTHIKQFTISIDQIRMMDTKPKQEIVSLYEFLKRKQEDDYVNQLKRSRKIDIQIGSGFEDVYVYADPNHLELIFKNLIDNSLRATEKMANKFRRAKNEYVETISFMVESQDEKIIRLIYSDNGCGITEEISRNLYKEPCSTKDGKDGHGLGGIIIRKLLEINDGSIAIVNSNTDGQQTGLTQKVVLSKMPASGVVL